MSRLNSFEVIIALLFIVFGFLLLASNLGLFAFDWSMVWALILIALGGWFIWRAFQPQPFVAQPGAAYGFGDYHPDLAGKEIRKENFSHGFGDFDLDLTRAVFPDGTNSVRASHGFGDVTVILPRDLAVRVKASGGFGDVHVFGQRSEGIGPVLTFQSEDYATAARKLDLEVSFGFGEAKVVRA
jgi:predicted membrane protein